MLFQSLDTASVVGVIVSAAIAWFLSSAFSSWYRLRHIPGPGLAAVSHLWLVINNLRRISGPQMVKVKKYGPLVRIGPNYIVTDDPNTLRQIAGVRNAYPRAQWWLGTRHDARHDSMLSTTDTQWHDSIKNKVMAAYNGRDGVDIEGTIDSQLNALVGVIRARHLSTGIEARAVEMSALLKDFTLDTVTKLVFGRALGFLASEQDLFGYSEIADQTAKIVGLFLDTPFLRFLMQSPIGPYIMPRPSDPKGFGAMLKIGLDHVRKTYETPDSEQKDFIASHLRQGVTLKESEMESMVPLLAGSDTVPTAMRSTLLYLIATPRAFNRLKEEIREAIASGVVQDDSIITNEDAKKLPYLQAVVYEGLRMRPPVLYGHFKHVPPEGATLNGVFIPGGTEIGHNSCAMMQSADIFGADVEIFRPERFLDCDGDKRLEMERTIDVMFGSGRWTCAGKSIALMQFSKTYFELLRRFDFQLVDPSRPWVEESTVVWIHSHFNVRISEA